MDTNKSKADKERITIFLDQDLAERARFHVALEKTTIPDYIKKLLNENLPRIMVHREKDETVMRVDFISDSTNIQKEVKKKEKIRLAKNAIEKILSTDKK